MDRPGFAGFKALICCSLYLSFRMTASWRHTRQETVSFNGPVAGGSQLLIVSREARSEILFTLALTAGRVNRIAPVSGIKKNLGQKITLAVFLEN